MGENENYRVAIDILCCHLGMSFDEACEELGLTGNEQDKNPLSSLSQTQQSLVGLLPEEK
ncbi:hypothetical protein CS022_23460 [Veronia nyctiphanis]|uniref:Dethiobiotin synthetase n=1 Tax=Veronia nyctiphanis TaxID=1278244 RepID=A0A4V1LS41_9GAMM|nr:hypothetical protein [Veronia nyctiphanis]RXJ70378.1 hypothetical protein CS022_23460 [Veronia nyctiphanis]